MRATVEQVFRTAVLSNCACKIEDAMMRGSSLCCYVALRVAFASFALECITFGVSADDLLPSQVRTASKRRG